MFARKYLCVIHFMYSILGECFSHGVQVVTGQEEGGGGGEKAAVTRPSSGAKIKPHGAPSAQTPTPARSDDPAPTTHKKYRNQAVKVRQRDRNVG